MNAGTNGSRRPPALAAALAGIALLAAACSGGGSSPALAGTTAYQKSLAYAQCMRSHGEPGYPDPASNGGFEIDGQKDHLNGALMTSANKACQHLLPASKPLTGTQQRLLTAEALKFVACMREHGFPGMADPTVNSSGVRISLAGAGDPGPGSPITQNAQRACQKLLPGGPP
jgi:hypothetical protein